MKRAVVLILGLVLLLGAGSDSKLSDRQRASHVLNRLAFGPRPGDVDRVLKDGVDAWIDQQLHPEQIPDNAVEGRLQKLPTLRMASSEIMQKYLVRFQDIRNEAKRAMQGSNDPAATQKEVIRRMEAMIPPEERPKRVMEELTTQRIVRAAESDRQLNEVMVDFWFNHFNVFAGKGTDHLLLTGYERDTIRPHLWGRFEDFLMATAKSPAMLVYLDNARSRRGGLNENYAREIMELHTLGVDGGYTQNDVTELARVFTGWSIDPLTGNFLFRAMAHDSGEKTVLGIHFPAGGGIEEGAKMIHVLAHHPATAHHIAYKLAQRLVADDPPKALVDRVARKFLDSDGELRQTVKAVIDSPEFRDAKFYRAKVKAPFEYVISAIRATNATVDDPLPIARVLQQAGEGLYGAQPPTGYSDKAEAWVNTGALMMRLNFALALAANRIPGIHTDVVSLIPAEAATEADRSVDAMAAAITGGDLSAETRQTIRSRVIDRKSPAEDPRDNTQLPMIAGLILGSPEFQRQ